MLAGMGQRLKLPGAKDKTPKESNLVITGDIGCYTLGAYPPLNAMDTTACMGASIGQAIGMEKAGLSAKIVAVIGDSTFLHSGITPLVDAVYNQSKITVVILDNSTTAMTGHQEHPGTGISVQGQPVGKVILEDLVKGVGVKNLAVVDSFNIKEIRTAVKDALDSQELSVIIVRGACAVHVPKHGEREQSIPTNVTSAASACWSAARQFKPTANSQSSISHVHRLHHLSADLPQTGNRAGIPDSIRGKKLSTKSENRPAHDRSRRTGEYPGQRHHR